MARTEAQAMLRVARRDLRAARLLAVDEADEASWGFQMQQAIEKAFKAWILSRDLKAPFTHDIADLLQILSEQGRASRSVPTCSSRNSPCLLFNSATTTTQSHWISIASTGSQWCRPCWMKWICGLKGACHDPPA